MRTSVTKANSHKEQRLQLTQEFFFKEEVFKKRQILNDVPPTEKELWANFLACVTLETKIEEFWKNSAIDIDKLEKQEEILEKLKLKIDQSENQALQASFKIHPQLSGVHIIGQNLTLIQFEKIVKVVEEIINNENKL